MQIIPHCDLLPYNSFGISQHCDKLIRYSHTFDARRVTWELDDGSDTPYMVIGGGSNLLFTRDFHGTIVTPEPYFDVEVHKLPYSDEHVDIRCWAGTTFDDVVDWAIEHGLYGLENLSLVPGQCGAAAVQNIGAYGVEIKDFVVSVDAVKIKNEKEGVRYQVFLPSTLGYGYRRSRFKGDWHNEYLITYVWLRLSRKFKPKLDYGNIRQALQDKGIVPEEVTPRQLRDTIIEIRRAKLPDPKVLGNAGSFFMNPIVDEQTLNRLKAEHPDLRYFEMPPEDDYFPYDDDEEEEPPHIQYKIPAGWLIEQCGWKGKRMGPAGVYEKQALVLVNHGGAKGQDIVNLMHAIQDDVKEKFGLELKPEVNIL